MNKQISSLQNPIIKHCILLQEKSRERKKTKSFIVEGQREVELALKGGYNLHTLFYTSEIVGDKILSKLKEKVGDGTECIEITRAVYEKLAYRSSTEGIVAIAKTKDQSLKNLTFATKTPLILVAEAPEKPGNIGALLRTADAANVDAVIIANPKTDIFNPNIIRSSVGCVFTNTIATGSTAEIIAFLAAKQIDIYAATLQASFAYHTCDYTGGAAIVVGTEATGLSESWRTHSKQNIIIPMQGEIDSMNVSVAAGIIIFEAKRQRNFK